MTGMSGRIEFPRATSSPQKEKNSSVGNEKKKQGKIK
jgi:hypothetical protein